MRGAIRAASCQAVFAYNVLKRRESSFSSGKRSFAACEDGNKGKAFVLEELWRRFFEDRSQWWDIRVKKKNSRCPDFVHVITKEGLWIDGWSNPSWVAGELAALKGDGLSCGGGVKAGLLPDSSEACEDSRRNYVRVAQKEGCYLCFESFRRSYEKGQLADALQAVNFMQQQGICGSSDIFYCLLQRCIDSKDLAAGRYVHYLIRMCGLEADSFLGSHLIRMFASCGSLSEANQIFKGLSEKNVYAWSASILANAKLGQGELAIQLYRQMQTSNVKPNEYVFVAVLKACASTTDLRQGKLVHVHIIKSGVEFSVIVGNTLIDMYAKCGSLEDVKRLFGHLPKWSLVTWTAMIGGYAQHGHSVEALQLYEEMQQMGMEPDIVTFVSTLKACSSVAVLDQGKLIHSHIIKSGFEADAFVGSTLVEMYAKGGSLEDAPKVFSKLQKRDSVTWTSMIAAYAMHGKYEVGMQYFHNMQQEGLKPDGVSFVCLLTACSHLGLVDKGFQHFESMTKDYGIKPTHNHYACMVDILGRAGCLEEAEDLLQSTPFCNIVGRTSLLSNSRIYGNAEIGRRSFDSMLTTDPKGASGYVLMSKLYDDVGAWKFQEKCRSNLGNLTLR